MTVFETALLTFVANAVWQVALVAAAAEACLRVAARAPAWSRHAIAVLALALAVLLPVRSAFVRPARPSSSASAIPAPGTGTASPSEVSAADRPTPAVREHRVSISRNAGRTVIAVYLLVVLLRAARLGRAWARARALRAGMRDVPPFVAALAGRCREALGMGAVPIHASPAVTTPVTVGAWRPVILLPEVLALSGSPVSLRAALGHELAHVRRRDFAVNLACELLALPIGFHPATALLRTRIREGREQACDDLVAANIQDAFTYARALVSLAATFGARAVPTAALGIFDPLSLEVRVMRLLRRDVDAGAFARRWLVVASGAVMAATAMVASAAALTVAERDGAPALSPPPGVVETALATAFGERSPRSGEYTYDSHAKRDPFLDLRTHGPQPTDTHDPRGFLIQEVALRGVVKAATGWKAMIVGPDGRTYFVSVGQAFYDGTLTAVDAAGISVQQQVRDPLSPPRARDLRLTLHPEGN